MLVVVSKAFFLEDKKSLLNQVDDEFYDKLVRKRDKIVRKRDKLFRERGKLVRKRGKLVRELFDILRLLTVPVL